MKNIVPNPKALKLDLDKNFLGLAEFFKLKLFLGIAYEDKWYKYR